MSFGNMDYIIKVTRELEVGIPHIILDTSGKHECSEYCPQTDELIYTKLGMDGLFQLAHELRHKWQWESIRKSILLIIKSWMRLI